MFQATPASDVAYCRITSNDVQDLIDPVPISVELPLPPRLPVNRRMSMKSFLARGERTILRVSSGEDIRVHRLPAVFAVDGRLGDVR